MPEREFKSILPDVIIRQCESTPNVAVPKFSTDRLEVNQREFAMQVDQVGRFYACGGREAKFSIETGADPDWVRLYLNGQVMVALLHQRGIITFHASSFIHDKKGVMILGESGAGKSSLTAAFTLGGAGFLTDDVTPVIFRAANPHIWSLHETIRIRKHTAVQLNVESEKLHEAEPGSGKQYMSVSRAGVDDHPLSVILIIAIGEVEKPVFEEPLSAEKFALLRSEICMSEILAGMPETEAAYLQQLVRIIEQVRFIKVVRPAEIKIRELCEEISAYL